MKATKRQSIPKRWIVISIPQGRGAYWFAYDQTGRKAVNCDDDIAAAEVCRIGNMLEQ